MLIGEALGEQEAQVGEPFVGRAGFTLMQLMQRAGVRREDFLIANAVWCRPPQNKLSGEEYEVGAIAHCRQAHLLPLIKAAGPRVLVPLGNSALFSVAGVRNILDRRGYVEVDPILNAFILPTVHPSFIMRGNTNYGAVFIRDLLRAVEVGEEGWKPAKKDYVLDPHPFEAANWARQYLNALNSVNPDLRLAYDIETPMKGEKESEIDCDDPSFYIYRIGFSHGANSGISMPWKPDYMPAIRMVLGSPGEKIVWNGDYDTPRIQANGITIKGLIHDAMIAWHVLHTDLPKDLGFVASLMLKDQARWKHLSSTDPAYYNANDCDVTWQLMQKTEELLKQTDQWDRVYVRHVVQLDPLLKHLHDVGMPIDLSIRAESAVKIDQRLREIKVEMQKIVPFAVKELKVYERLPKDIDQRKLRGVQYTQVESTTETKQCPKCGKQGKFSEKRHPCKVPLELIKVPCFKYAEVLEWKPSNKGLKNYAHARRHNPVFKGKGQDRKVTFDEKAIRKLITRYPQDELYPLILEYRELDKIAGTYVGRPVEEEARAA